jgi:hypothetical protein
MYDFHSNTLPSAFNGFFTPTTSIHNYRTRLASKDSYYIGKIRTNYGKFNIRYVGAIAWNSIHAEVKKSTRSVLKKRIIDGILEKY